MPIVNVEGIGRIEFPDTMSRDEIDAAVKRDILPLLERRAPGPVASVSPQLAAPTPMAETPLPPTPFSKGTAVADTNYKVGDRYRYRVVDLLTKLESGERRGGIVTAVTDTEVVYNNGRRVTDLLGNTVRNPRGQTFTGNQIFVAEYRVGRKWSTTYHGLRRDLEPEDWSFDFKVVAREPVTVPAGTFDAFKVEGEGYSKATGHHYVWTYWIAPEKVRVYVAFEQVQRARKGGLRVTDRMELVAFHQG